jgi:ABC-type glycerol-3-phosphate transport system permease component
MLLASVQSTQQIYAGVQLIPKGINWSNYVQAWGKRALGRYLANSVLYTTTVTAMVLALGTAGAYAFARLRFPARTSSTT